MLTETQVRDYLKLHDMVSTKIAEVVTLYGEINDCDYRVDDFEFEEKTDRVLAFVNYYKYQDTNYDSVYFDVDELFNEEKFNKLVTEARAEQAKREIDRQTKEVERQQNKVEQELKHLEYLKSKYNIGCGCGCGRTPCLEDL